MYIDKGNFENFVRKTAEEGGVLYIKEKDSDIWGPLQSRPLHNQSPINSIRTKEDVVNALPDNNTLWQAEKNLHNHNVPREVVENLPKLLADPVSVFRSNTKAEAY